MGTIKYEVWKRKSLNENTKDIASAMGISARMVAYHSDQFQKDLEQARETFSYFFDFIIERGLQGPFFDSDLKNELEKHLREILNHEKTTFFVTSEQPDKNSPWMAKFVVDKYD